MCIFKDFFVYAINLKNKVNLKTKDFIEIQINNQFNVINNMNQTNVKTDTNEIDKIDNIDEINERDKEKLKNLVVSFAEFKKFARNNHLRFILENLIDKIEFKRLFMS